MTGAPAALADHATTLVALPESLILTSGGLYQKRSSLNWVFVYPYLYFVLAQTTVLGPRWQIGL